MKEILILLVISFCLLFMRSQRINEKSFQKKIVMPNEPNIIDKCSTIAKNFGNKIFGIKSNNTCLIGFKNNYRTNIFTVFEYNKSYPPYINIGKLSRCISKKGYSLIKINKIIGKYNNKYANGKSTSKKLIDLAINYDGNDFYHDIIINMKYHDIFKDGFQIHMKQVDNTMDNNMFNLVYSKNDGTDTILYKILMKLKLIYNLNHWINNDIIHIRQIISQIIKHKNCDLNWNIDMFNDLINQKCNDKSIKDILQQVLRINFIAKDFNEIKNKCD